MNSQPDSRFRVLVPVRDLLRSMPRSGLPRGECSRLAYAFAADTLAVIRSCPSVAEIVVVSPDPEVERLASEVGATFVEVRRGTGVDAALDHAHAVTSGEPVDMVAAIVGDLPALDRGELEAVLAEAGRSRSAAYVTDLSGRGITLQAEPADTFSACFESDPVRRLFARATELGQATGGLRCDVDTSGALRVATFLGVGRRTADELAVLGDRVLRTAAVA